MAMRRGLRQTLVSLLCVLVPTSFKSIAFADAEPAEKYFTYEQRAGLAELDQLNVIVAELVNQEKYTECLAIAEYGLAIQRAVGDYDREIAVTLGFMAELRKRTDDLAGSLRDREEVLQFQTKLLGPEHWKTADARREVARAKRLAQFTAVQREELSKASALIDKSVKLSRAGKAAEALAPAQQAVEIKRKLLGEQDADFAIDLTNLARVYKALRKLDESENLLASALAVQQQNLCERHPECATTISLLAEVYDERGLPARSLPLYQQALEIRKATLGEKDFYFGQSVDALANWYKAAGEYSKAEPLFLQSLEIFRELNGEKSPNYATVLNNLGRFYTQAGDYSRAHQTLQQSLVLRKELSGDRDPTYATILADLAFLANRIGDHDRAVALYTEAAAIDKERFGEKHYRYALRIGNLAATYADAGEFEKAEPLYRKDLEITKALVGEHHPKHAANLNHLGLLYLHMGDRARAEPLLRQALAIRQSTLGDKHRDTSDNLIDLATVVSQSGDHEEAISLLKQALAIRRAIFPEGHQDVAMALHNLGTAYTELRQYDQAKASYEQAAEVMRSAVGEAHPGYATMLNSLAHVLLTTGEYDTAKPMLLTALAIAERSLGTRDEARLQIQKNLATLYQCTQDYDKAEPLLIAAIEAAREQLELTAALQSERQQLAMRLTVWQYLNAYLELAGRSREPTERAYAHVLRWKGEVGVRQQQARRTRRLAAGDNPAAARLQSELTTTTRDLARLSRSKSLRTADASTQLAALHDRIETLQTELAAVSADFQRELIQQQRTPNDIRSALPDNAALVDLLTADYLIPNPEKGRPAKYETHLIAFVLRRDAPIERVELGPAETIQNKIHSWRKQFGAISAGADPGAELRKLLWEPVAEHVGNAKLLLISPHAMTAALPWGALPGKAPDKYLIEELDIAVVPVPVLLPDLLANAHASANGSTTTPSLLLVGDVDFDAPSQSSVAANSPHSRPNDAPLPGRLATRGAEPLAWKPLPGTRDEIAAIKASFGKRFDGAAPTVLTQRAATKSAICDAATSHQYLHFSTHGFFAPANPTSALNASARERGDKATVTAAIGIPGLLSGLVLAGANRIPAEGEEDGILTALEVGELDLGNVELATLSACETGLGETAGGEGLLGLQRAFQTAGAKAVVSGLWQVPDKATQILMARFYDNLWQKKMSRLEALMAAQRSMLNLSPADRERLRGLDLEPDQPQVDAADRLPPFYWAAFVLSGDWR